MRGAYRLSMTASTKLNAAATTRESPFRIGLRAACIEQLSQWELLPQNDTVESTAMRMAAYYAFAGRFALHP